MKPGYQTTEFWSSLIAQGLSLAVILGFVSAGDSVMLQDSLSKALAAIATLVVNAFVVVHYIRARVEAKRGQGAAGFTPPLPLIIAAIVLLFSCGPATAQSMFPWRNDVEKRLHALEGGAPQQRGLSEVEQLRRQVAELQAALRSGQGASPAPQVEKHYYIPFSPKMELPPGFAPKMELAPGFAPKMELAPGFAPKIDLAPGFAPKQELPPGFTPKQDLPPGFAPKIDLNKPPDPAPVDPLKKPMPPPPATGLQRFTEGRPPIIYPSWSASPPVIHAVTTPWKGN